MTHAKCKIMVMAMMDMDSMRNILIEMWDTFIYMIIMCKYVLLNEDIVPTYFDMWRFFYNNEVYKKDRLEICKILENSKNLVRLTNNGVNCGKKSLFIPPTHFFQAG